MLLSFAFPAADWNWIAWVALVPLLVTLEEVPPRQAFWLGWTTGIFFYLATLYWIVYTIGTYTPMPVVLAVVPLLLLAAVLALYHGAFAAGIVYTARRGIEPVLFAPLWWVALEWVRSFFPVGFPWASLGYSQYRARSLMQIAELTGVYGLSALVVLFGVVIASIVTGRGTTTARAAHLGVLSIVLIAAQQFGSWRVRDLAARESAHTLRAAVVQGNIAQERKWDPALQDATITIYEQLTKQAARQQPTLVVWPETAVPFFFTDDAPLAQRVRAVPRDTNAWLLFGSPAADAAPAANRRLRNRAYLLNPDGATVGHYDKVKLVPFGEYVPFQPLLFFVDKMVEGADAFGAGPDPTPLAVDGHRVGVLICYEAIFPSLARRLVARDATLLVNITNDAWFGPTAAPYQHLAMATLRAVENRVPLLRAANTGISAVIRPDGEILHATELFEPAYRVADLSWPDVHTVYTRFGDVFAAVCVVCSSALLLAANPSGWLRRIPLGRRRGGIGVPPPRM